MKLLNDDGSYYFRFVTERLTKVFKDHESRLFGKYGQDFFEWADLNFSWVKKYSYCIESIESAYKKCLECAQELNNRSSVNWQHGDACIYYNESRRKYADARISSNCVVRDPFIPFYDKGGWGDMSGGPWIGINPKLIQNAGKRQVLFWTWGVTVGGEEGVYFYADVNNWIYAEEFKGYYSTELTAHLYIDDRRIVVMRDFTSCESFKSKREFINWLKSQNLKLGDRSPHAKHRMGIIESHVLTKKYNRQKGVIVA